MLSDVRLPPAETQEQFVAVRRDESRLGPAVSALLRHLGLGGEPVGRFAGGSLPVYAVGDRHVLKLYPEVCLPEQYDTELTVLRAVEGRLPIATPRVLDAEHLDGWSYILMTRLPGESLAEAWPRIPRDDRVELAAAVGETLAALHSVSSPGLDAVVGPHDFEPAMRGAREYEYASVGLFLTCGEGGILRRLLLAYGYRDRDLGEGLSRRLLAYALLHRYSSLAWYLTRLPAPPRPTLDLLATHWWAL